MSFSLPWQVDANQNSRTAANFISDCCKGHQWRDLRCGEVSLQWYIDGFNYRAWHYKNYHVTKTGSHFVGQKGNQINRVSLVIQY